MPIWSSEIKELEKLSESLKGQLPDLEKELDRLIKVDDENIILLYSRRCLEVIITDLCECELKRPRKTEPLQGIIDKLNREGKVPSHIIASMHGLNELSTYGAHPKDFDPEQVKPVLNNLDIIIKWYLKYKGGSTEVKGMLAGEIRQEVKSTKDVKKSIKISNIRLVRFILGIIVFIAILLAIFFFTKIIGSSKKINKLEKTIAVLPLLNLGNDTLQLPFCDGFMEDLINNLQKIRSFTVRPRTSSYQYKNARKSTAQIRKEINVNYLVGGSVEHEGNYYKIRTYLIDSNADKQIWSNDYICELNKSFSRVSEIVKDIASELKVVPSANEIEMIDKRPSVNPEAYKYYLQGDYLHWKNYNTIDFSGAIELFKKAIELDPRFALAYTGIAMCLIDQYWYYKDHSDETLRKCKLAIDKAFEIDPDLPDAHLALGIYYFHGFLNYQEALKQFELILKDNPKNVSAIEWSAAVFRRAGNWEMAKSYFEKAYELDPGSSSLAQEAGEISDMLRDYIKAEEFYNRSIILQPDFIYAYITLANMILRWKGDTKKAREILEEAALSNKFSLSDSLVIETNILIDLCEGSYQAALKEVSLFKNDVIQTPWFLRLKYLYYANIYGLMNEPDLAHAYYDSTRLFIENKITTINDEPALYSSLGLAYAGLGLKEKAIKAGIKGVELMPISKDAIQGACRAEDLALINVMVGNYYDAIKQLKYILSIPGFLTTRLIELDPKWAPLRKQPEFKRMLLNHPIR